MDNNYRFYTDFPWSKLTKRWFHFQQKYLIQTLSVMTKKVKQLCAGAYVIKQRHPVASTCGYIAAFAW